jgi:hypothetical protein
MAKREIIDSFNNFSGEKLARYVWRSKPTRSPLTGRQVRCVVAQDEKGRYWAGLRIGRGNGQKAEYEMWETCRTKQEAISISRQQARIALSTAAELYANTIKDKKPGEQIVKVTMDDGWSVAINAPGRVSPAEARVMKLFEGHGKKKESPAKSLSRGRWPSIDR